MLLRDYGRLDTKQMKFCRAANGRLGEGEGLEWYARGDGTTAVFFTVETVERLATACGFEVEEVRYDRRLIVNRADRTKMHRVWVMASLRRPDTEAKHRRLIGGMLKLVPPWLCSDYRALYGHRNTCLALLLVSAIAGIAGLLSRPLSRRLGHVH